jgi:type 1 fimbria pilin
MISTFTKQKLALLASAMALALMTAQAQSADGTVVISGQINANTCTLNIADSTGVASPTNKGTRSVELGTVSPTGTTVSTPFGTKQNITFSLSAASGTGACTFTSGTGWNLALDLQSSQVSSVSGKPFLTNSATTGAATNVGVALFDNAGAQITTLATGQGYQGTKLSSTGVSSSASLTMGAQFIATSATPPTAGLFSASVPLLIVYN